MANYSKIKYFDIANGDGIHTSIFFSGCPHHCKGCFNPETWNKNNGKKFSENEKQAILNSLQSSHINGLSILGGEPLVDYNINTVIDLCKEVKINFPNKKIWLWSGYKFEEIQNSSKKDILDYIDFFIDGRFEKDKKNLNLKWRGSSNQKVWYKEDKIWRIKNL